MPDYLLSALALATDPATIGATTLGVVIGLVFGILPGLSGLSALAILLPFIYGMEPMTALGFLLGAHAAVCTGGSVTAIVLGIPGAPTNAATVRDGFAMQQAGRGSRAVGAALFASAAGGIVGAIVLVALLPSLRPVVLSFGAPEIFLLGVLGLLWAALAGQGPAIHALFAAALGIFLSTFGYQRITGVPRFWFEFDYLLDGIRLVPLVLGLFAVPEIIRLATARDPTRRDHAPAVDLVEMTAGFLDVLRRPLLFLRSALIGVVVGIVPGVGGETAPFLAHATARRRFERRHGRTADGIIEGVIAPEASNNAKEGGSLVPTLALGIPGSASMAILIGGFLVMGLEPGPDFLENHLDVAAGLGLILAGTNLLGAALMIPLTLGVVRFSRLPGRFIAPLLLILVVIGAYVSNREVMDVVFVFLFGLLGLFMVNLDYSRPLLVLGFVLGPIIETYFFISLRAYGAEIFHRPLSLALMVLIIVGAATTLPLKRIGLRRRDGEKP